MAEKFFKISKFPIISELILCSTIHGSKVFRSSHFSILNLILKYFENCVGKNQNLVFFRSVFATEKYGYKIFPIFEFFEFFMN